MNKQQRRECGFTLIELMVAIAVGSLIVIGVVTVFSGQANSIRQETGRDSLHKEVSSAFNTISTLLRHAESNSVVLTIGNNGQPNGAGNFYVADDSLTVDFMLPAGFPIWPNDVAPYANRAIRLTWTNDVKNADRDTVMIGSANARAGLAVAPLTRLSGMAAEGGPHILNFDLWPATVNGAPAANAAVPANGGYLLRIDARSGQLDTSYVNPQDLKGPYKHYRTAWAAGAVMPRN